MAGSKVKLFFLPSPMCPILDLFLLQRCAGTFPMDSQSFTKALLSVGDCQSQCSLGGRW